MAAVINLTVSKGPSTEKEGKDSKGRNLLGKDKEPLELPGPPSPGAPSEIIPVKEEDIEEIKMDGGGKYNTDGEEK